ncbi:hypothetical protein E1B28_000592 [Marasmius oreades]|uniref:Tail specific protease domain-containing protein n=1 Tax=Marasmius oreades TaxID=181124 RepID=A0A9P7V1M5_9AGAR|nr:uncharacterized protein E1B28_000592 [Marasmius oreades]KAG7098678.1 hypothetical protein E1B28_000592 [Marasmius oreades]
MKLTDLLSTKLWFYATLVFTAHGKELGAQRPLHTDPCAAISEKKWVSPREARECLSSYPVDPVVKANILEVANKTLAFHTSTYYQIQAPPPFEGDIHEDLHRSIARISQEEYQSEFEFHLDLFRTFKRVNDGHCVVINYCYDSLYISYLPTPLVLLTEADGQSQNVYIAPEAFQVATAEFGSEMEHWQNVLPEHLRGQLESLNGARVLLIDGADPWVAVNKNAETTGSYQAFSTRQNSFFSSYSRGDKGWLYTMGNFAQQVHPLTDEVTLTIRRVNRRTIDVITLPYRSRLGSFAKNFTDLPTFRSRNCIAKVGTNGVDLYSELNSSSIDELEVPKPVTAFQQQPPVTIEDARRNPMNVILDGAPLTNIELPETLTPSGTPLNSSYTVAQFYTLKGEDVGVLALGSFSARIFTLFQKSLLEGLQELKEYGVRKLIVDVSNNGGGYICIAHWLHRIIVGPKSTTEPQAGLDSATRAGSLAQLIVKNIAAGGDPEELLEYNPIQWSNASHVKFANGTDWMEPLDNRKVNGREDPFSQRLGQECQPFGMEPPAEPLFKPQDVVIISNGRCASSCALFSITMSKLESVKTVVVGGKSDVPQQYCGTVGGQSTDFSTIDTEIKSTHLKNHTLAPPDLIANVVQGITWRLGFGFGQHSEEPEEWLDHPADMNLPLTAETVNNPMAIWEEVSEVVFGVTPQLLVQGY